MLIIVALEIDDIGIGPNVWCFFYVDPVCSENWNK